MTELSPAVAAPEVEAHAHSTGAVLRFIVIALTAFLTVVDLFATQAILPSLTKHYGVTPAAMGFAVNASTMGMAVSGLAVGYFSRSIDRRMGILLSLLVLSIPTALLAHAPDLTTFTLLRVAQGLCMAAAFTLTLAYLGEHYSAADSASAFAAYITGNVASNLIGRLISAGRRRPFRPRRQFLLLRLAQSARRRTGLFHRREGAADARHGRQHELAFRGVDHASQEPVPARELRHRLLHPVRLHRHLHLRQFRAGTAAARRRHR